jgi:hypothetical protein
VTDATPISNPTIRVIADSDRYEVTAGHPNGFYLLTKKAIPGMQAQRLWITPRLVGDRQDLMTQTQLWLKQYLDGQDLITVLAWVVYALTQAAPKP